MTADPGSAAAAPLSLGEAALLERWSAARLRHGFHRLLEPWSGEHELRTAWGAYALVRFRAQPADALTLRFAEEWPPSVDAAYASDLRDAVLHGVLDALLTDADLPYRGCALTLERVAYDEVNGSEIAFRMAAWNAMRDLREGGRWDRGGDDVRPYRAAERAR